MNVQQITAYFLEHELHEFPQINTKNILFQYQFYHINRVDLWKFVFSLFISCV